MHHDVEKYASSEFMWLTDKFQSFHFFMDAAVIMESSYLKCKSKVGDRVQGQTSCCA